MNDSKKEKSRLYAQIKRQKINADPILREKYLENKKLEKIKHKNKINPNWKEDKHNKEKQKELIAKQKKLEKTKRQRDRAFALLIKKAWAPKSPKTCSCCGVSLDETNSYKLSTYCKKCHNENCVKRAKGEKYKEYRKEYKLANKEKLKNKQKIYMGEYLKKPENRLIFNIRRRLSDFIRSKNSADRAGVGCTKEFLISHIERQFNNGMTWDNYGTVWHIDHIIPISKFKRTKEELLKANHFTNLQPMMALDNMSKGNKIIGIVQPELCMSY